MFPVKYWSTISVRNNPAIPTGIIEINILNTYFVSSFNLNLKNPLNKSAISFQSTAIVLRTVAPWTATEK
jgi:hypothetical protein